MRFNFFGRCRVCVFSFFVLVPCAFVFVCFPFLSLCLVQLYLWWIRARLAGTGARSDGRIENKSDNKSSTFCNNWVNNGKALLWLQYYYWSLFWTKSYLGTKFSEVRPKYISWRREGQLAHSPFLNKLRQFCLSTPALPYLGIPLAQGKILCFPILNIVNSKIKANLGEGFQKKISQAQRSWRITISKKMLRGTMSPGLE